MFTLNEEHVLAAQRLRDEEPAWWEFAEPSQALFDRMSARELLEYARRQHWTVEEILAREG